MSSAPVQAHPQAHSQAQALMARQHALRMRSALLRHELARELQPLQRPLVLADRVHAAWQGLRARPELLLGALVGLAIVRPRRAWRWSLSLWWAWRQWRRLQRWLHAPP